MTERVLLGDLGGGDWGLLVSVPGKSVLGSLTPNDKAFDSRLPEGARLIMSGRTALNTTVSLPGVFSDFAIVVSYQALSGGLHQAQPLTICKLTTTSFVSLGYYMVFGYNG